MSPHKRTTVVTKPWPQTDPGLRSRPRALPTNQRSSGFDVVVVCQPASTQSRLPILLRAAAIPQRGHARLRSMTEVVSIFSVTLTQIEPRMDPHVDGKRKKPYGSVQMRFGNSRGNALRRQLQHEMQAMKMFAVTPECQRASRIRF